MVVQDRIHMKIYICSYVHICAWMFNVEKRILKNNSFVKRVEYVCINTSLRKSYASYLFCFAYLFQNLHLFLFHFCSFLASLLSLFIFLIISQYFPLSSFLSVYFSFSTLCYLSLFPPSLTYAASFCSHLFLFSPKMKFLGQWKSFSWYFFFKYLYKLVCCDLMPAFK